MQRTLGIGLALALVVGVLVGVASYRPSLLRRSVVGDSDTAASPRVAPPGDEEAEENEREAREREQQSPSPPAPIVPPVITAPAGSAAVEQTAHGDKPSAVLVESFDGLGVGFEGPQGTANFRNPSDNALAVGSNHIVQIVNSQTAIFTKKGKKFDATGRVLYGPVPTANFFKGFGGQCEATNNGDAVVRYDQVANRWLVVMPLFRRGPVRPDQPEVWTASEKAYISPPGRPGQPGQAAPLYQPPPPPPAPPAAPGQRGRGQGGGRAQGPQGPYSMCYAISASDDPMGSYYRYEFLRPLFPDYPRPAIWNDGYYVPTSTGDEVIQKHACIVDRARMLKGEAATEQCMILEGVGFLNNADVDGKSMPPSGAPNIMMSAGGTQLKNVLEDDTIYAWKLSVDWKNPGRRAWWDQKRSPSHRTTTFAMVSSRTASRSLGPTAVWILKATRSCRVSSTGGWATANPLLACTPSTPQPAAAACAGTSSASTTNPGISLSRNRARSRPTRSSAGWPARRSIALATSVSATRSAGRRTSPASGLRAGRLAIRRES